MMLRLGLSGPLANKLPSVTAKHFRPEHLLPFFCNPVPMFLCIVESWPCFRCQRSDFSAAVLPLRTLLGQTSPGSTWVYLSPTGVCHFWADGTDGHISISNGNKLDVFFISCTKFTWPSTASTILNVACLFVLLQRPRKTHLETPFCFEIIVSERPCWCNITISCLVAVLRLAMVYDPWHETVFHNLTLLAELGCSSPSFKFPRQLFLTVFQPTCEIVDH